MTDERPRVIAQTTNQCMYRGWNSEGQRETQCVLIINHSGAHKCVADTPAHDPVNHPRHYTEHPSGVECITVTEHFNFNLGNAIKYIWRAGLKGGIEDLKKARWYVDREIQRIEKEKGSK